MYLDQRVFRNAWCNSLGLAVLYSYLVPREKEAPHFYLFSFVFVSHCQIPWFISILENRWSSLPRESARKACRTRRESSGKPTDSNQSLPFINQVVKTVCRTPVRICSHNLPIDKNSDSHSLWVYIPVFDQLLLANDQIQRRSSVACSESLLLTDWGASVTRPVENRTSSRWNIVILLMWVDLPVIILTKTWWIVQFPGVIKIVNTRFSLEKHPIWRFSGHILGLCYL